MPPAARGGGPVAVTALEDVNARAKILMQNSTFSTFKESEGSTGYARWRKDLTAVASAAGQDFDLALHFQFNIP